MHSALRSDPDPLETGTPAENEGRFCPSDSSGRAVAFYDNSINIP